MLPNIVMYPLKLQQPQFPLGDQQQFNNLRVHLVMCLHAYLTAQPHPPHINFLQHIYGWMTDDRAYLCFERMPAITDFSVQNELNLHGLMGVYWLCNHHDTRGSFSRGQVGRALRARPAALSRRRREQVYDIEIALHKLRNYFAPEAAPLLDTLRKFLDACVDAATPVYMEPPPVVPSQPAQTHPRAPTVLLDSIPPRTPTPFDYVNDDAQGASASSSLSSILEQLKPALKHIPYSPANPLIGTAAPK